MFQNDKIVFVGAGSMAEAIIAGLLKNKLVKSEQIWATNHSNDERLHLLEQTFSIHTSRDNDMLFKDATMIILAMKPKDVASSLATIKQYFTPEQLLISVIAGVPHSFFDKTIGKPIPIIRTMPNTSAAVGQSATAIAPGTYSNENDLKKTQTFLQSIGTVLVVDEEELHAVTALAGSGPGYLYYIAQALEESALAQGLSKRVARKLMVDTFAGVAEMLKTTNEAPETLRKQVTSPGGTTEAGLNMLKKHQVKQAIHQCVHAAATKSRELEALN